MTNIQQRTRTRQVRRHENKMDSPVNFPSFKWAKHGTNDYFNAIDEINDVYRKMLMIGESKKVFHDKVCPMMTAKTKDDFKKAALELH